MEGGQRQRGEDKKSKVANVCGGGEGGVSRSGGGGGGREHRDWAPLRLLLLPLQEDVAEG